MVHGDTLTIADMQSLNATAISTTNLQTARLSSTSLTNWIKGSLTATGGDLGSHQAGWFTYLGNTCVIEQAHTQGSAWSSGDTLVEIVGTLSLTNAHISCHVLTV